MEISFSKKAYVRNLRKWSAQKLPKESKSYEKYWSWMWQWVKCFENWWKDPKEESYSRWMIYVCKCMYDVVPLGIEWAAAATVLIVYATALLLVRTCMCQRDSSFVSESMHVPTDSSFVSESMYVPTDSSFDFENIHMAKGRHVGSEKCTGSNLIISYSGILHESYLP